MSKSGQSRLVVVPCDLDEANAFVRQHHRHRDEVPGHKFSLAVVAEDDPWRVRGVAIVGRPVARPLDNGLRLEVVRVATDGSPNACSFLYAASWRAARALGYRQLGTYTLKSEPGTSLLAAGWKIVGEVKGRNWSCPSRPRVDRHPDQDKFRWEPGDSPAASSSHSPIP